MTKAQIIPVPVSPEVLNRSTAEVMSGLTRQELAAANRLQGETWVREIVEAKRDGRKISSESLDYEHFSD